MQPASESRRSSEARAAGLRATSILTLMDNRNTVIVGSKVTLVPYREEHVEEYHGWMQDETLLQQTASERLTLEEEYENCRSWREDPGKLTFIVKKGDELVGDVNLFLREDAEVEIMIVKYRRQGLGSQAMGLLLGYASSFFDGRFVAKIHKSNTASLGLFRRFGFEEVGYVEAFQEYELESRRSWPLEAGIASLDRPMGSVQYTCDEYAIFILYYSTTSAFVSVGKLEALCLAAPALFEDHMPVATSLIGDKGHSVARRLSKVSKRMLLLSWGLDEDDINAPYVEKFVAKRLLPYGYFPPVPLSDDDVFQLP